MAALPVRKAAIRDGGTVRYVEVRPGSEGTHLPTSGGRAWENGDVSTADTVTCPLDGEVLTMPTTEQRVDDFCAYVVVTDPGTAHAHIRDAHPRALAGNLRRPTEDER